MDFSTLPNWPVSLIGETKQSWMIAACRIQPIDEDDWWDLVQPSHREPERPIKGKRWNGLPSDLGEISTIAPTWRLSPMQRRVFCPLCWIQVGETRRWPTRIDWLDVRRLLCVDHDCVLVYRDPALGVDAGHAECQSEPELGQLYEWTQYWICLDQQLTKTAQLENKWRRDLVHMICRNWTARRSYSAAGIGAWELCRIGWFGQENKGALTGGHPARLGELHAPERIGSLLLAYRLWRYFRKETDAVPEIPRIAWSWLERTWVQRFEYRRSRTFVRLVRDLAMGG